MYTRCSCRCQQKKTAADSHITDARSLSNNGMKVDKKETLRQVAGAAFFFDVRGVDCGGCF